MNSGAATSKYHSPLRERQKAETRRRILEAVGRVVEAREGLERLSLAAVAREAEVRERTIYRHFGSREGLIDAFFGYRAARIGVGFPRGEEDLLGHGAKLFAGLQQEDAAHRAFMHSRAGREVFVRLGPAYRESFEKAVADAARGLTPRERRWLAAAANVLVSAGAWQVLHDRWEMSGMEAGRASRLAVAFLLAGARAQVAARRRERTRRPPDGDPSRGGS